MLKRQFQVWLGVGTLGWLLIVLALTSLPGRGTIMITIGTFFGQSDLHGALGHMGLMASLVIVLCVGLSQLIPSKYALFIATIIAFALGTATELHQADVFGRASTLLDLFGNWAGTFAMAYVLSFVISFLDKPHRQQ